MQDSSQDIIEYLREAFFVRIPKSEQVTTSELVSLVRSIKGFFSHVSYESLKGGVKIGLVDDCTSLGDSFVHIQSYTDLLREYPVCDRDKEAVLVSDIKNSSEYFLYDCDAESVVSSAILYYEMTKENKEYICFGSKRLLLSPPPGYGSFFTRFDFKRLEELLNEYHNHNARRSTCKILERCWYDEKRFYLRAQPEEYMRDSLLQFLRNTLGKYADVTPERNTDDSHPVDLNIDYRGSNRLAIIEVKWLGDSVNDDGKSTTNYRDARANEGARQLNNYLEDTNDYNPKQEIIGVLVVFDARRKGLKSSRNPTKDDLFFYRRTNISYKVEYDKVRHDFSRPVRFYMEPKLTV
ncbi:hypothetical protein [Idiomarina ramblicola]|uniref:Restriction endonuclease n=1 Tax=Idiomarina ramblicola TaxID=263724 RepID=A0A432Z0K2_9GAMM|nr:hypothetical protein [Idiomarina ramblicola]RUO69694.1 hypothetical protein CWI78_07145 [Idiomarina ramblicola]